VSLGAELKNDAMQTVALLGGVLAFVVMFYLYSRGIWAIVVVALVVGVLFFAIKMYQSGYRLNI